MPIRRLLQDSKLEADELENLTRAFNHALRNANRSSYRLKQQFEMVAGPGFKVSEASQL